MSQDYQQMLRAMRRVTTKFAPRALPRFCPYCGVRLVWGWAEEELWAPCEPGAVRLHRIPRQDQTVFCPRCEGSILN